MIKFLEKIGVIGTFLFTLWITVAVGHMIDWVNPGLQSLAQVVFYISLMVLSVVWVIFLIGTSPYPKTNNEPIRNAIRAFFGYLGWRND